MQLTNKKNRVFVLSLITVSLIALTWLSSSCRHHEATIENPANLANYTVVDGHAQGKAYGWDVLLIKVAECQYADAVQNLWENSGLSPEEQAKCTLVNIQVQKGTEWGIILVGQTYISVEADIVKNKL